jgi:uncharacterized protein YdeI (BOF family)
MKHFILSLLVVLISTTAFAQNQEATSDIKLTTDKNNPHPLNISFGQTKLSLFGYAQSTYAVENKSHKTMKKVIMSVCSIAALLGLVLNPSLKMVQTKIERKKEK